MLLKLGVNFGSGLVPSTGAGLFCVMFGAVLTTALQGRETVGGDECGDVLGMLDPPLEL